MLHRRSETTLIILGLVLVSGTCFAQAPQMPSPTKKHELLEQFAGEWTAVAETEAAPGTEPIKSEGTESAKVVGGFWLVGQGEADMNGMQFNSILTIGYDPKTDKYVGTFVCSMDSTMWKYEGSIDESGKKLTLLTEGPSMMDPSQTAKYRETLELVDEDHKLFTSSVQMPDGEWMKFMTVKYERKKPE